ncbi:hypothetical protein ACFXNW_19120 [Nocardia sp. NPDC059180]|uniref:hypothetical protein n=1 Tax=Nocardia sp. NPDC059180 TaxID=3346761 RepID=UPI0036C8BFA7
MRLETQHKPPPLGAAPDSAAWFRGGVVADSTEVEQRVLDVPDVPVVSETAATAMAEGGAVRTSHRQFDGDPAKVLDRSVQYAIELLLSGAKTITR